MPPTMESSIARMALQNWEKTGKIGLSPEAKIVFQKKIGVYMGFYPYKWPKIIWVTDGNWGL